MPAPIRARAASVIIKGLANFMGLSEVLFKVIARLDRAIHLLRLIFDLIFRVMDPLVKPEDDENRNFGYAIVKFKERACLSEV